MIYWIFVDGLKMERIEVKDRLTSFKKDTVCMKYAAAHEISQRGVTIKEVSAAQDKEWVARMAA